jgi:hypothetical protein
VYTSPSAFTAAVNSRPQATLTTSTMPSMRTKAVLLCASPVPSCPLPLAPAANSAPIVVNSIVWFGPQAPDLIRSPGSTAVGAYRFTVSPSPSWPSSLRPQQYARRSVSITTVCEAAGPENTCNTGGQREGGDDEEEGKVLSENNKEGDEEGDGEEGRGGGGGGGRRRRRRKKKEKEEEEPLAPSRDTRQRRWEEEIEVQWYNRYAQQRVRKSGL